VVTGEAARGPAERERYAALAKCLCTSAPHVADGVQPRCGSINTRFAKSAIRNDPHGDKGWAVLPLADADATASMAMPPCWMIERGGQAGLHGGGWDDLSLVW